MLPMAAARINSPHFTRLLQLATTLLAIIYMVYIGGTFDATVRFRPQLLDTVLAAGIGVAWLAARLKTRSRIKATGLEWPLIALVASQWIATAASLAPRLSIETTASLTLWAVAFIILCDLFAQGWPQTYVLNGLLVVSFLVAAETLWVMLVWAAPWLRQGQLPPFALRAFRPNTSLGNPNLIAIVLNLLLPLWIVRLVAPGSRRSRLAAGAGIFLSFAALVACASRAGTLATLATLGLMVVLLWRPVPVLIQWLRRQWQRWPGLWQGGSLAAALAVVALAAWRLGAPLVNYLLQGRWDYWRPAWEMFLASPLLGGGPGLHLVFQTRIDSIPPQLLFPHAHSLVIETLGSSGLVGGAALLWLGVAGAALVWRRLQRAQDRLLAVALLSGLAGAVVHHFLDHFFGTPVFMFLFVLVSALAFAPVEKDAPSPTWHPAWLGVPMALLTGIAVFALRGAALNSRGVELAAENRWGEAAQAFQQAAQSDPALSLYSENAAQAFARVGDVTQAIPLWRQAARLEPSWALPTASLALLTHDREAMRQALALAPQSYLLALNAGVLAEANGDTPAAQAYYIQALDLDPSLASALFWQQTPWRPQALGLWQARQPADQTPLAPCLAALQTKDYERARGCYELVYQKAPADPQAALGLARVWLALGNPQQAATYLSADHTLPDLPAMDTIEAEITRGDVALALGDTKSARAVYEWVFGVLGDYQSYEGPGSYGDSIRSWWLFHREGLPSDLMPQFIRGDITPAVDRSLAQLAQWYFAEHQTSNACFILQRVYREAPLSDSGRLWQKSCALGDSTNP
jgi:tetratricopeptide (TPR) repeat protein